MSSIARNCVLIATTLLVCVCAQSNPLERKLAGSASCSLYSGCAAFEGNCCPADDGRHLGCCESEKVPTAPPSPSPTDAPTADAKCSSKAVCAGQGLTGDCCPTPHGVMLGKTTLGIVFRSFFAVSEFSHLIPLTNFRLLRSYSQV